MASVADLSGPVLARAYIVQSAAGKIGVHSRGQPAAGRGARGCPAQVMNAPGDSNHHVLPVDIIASLNRACQDIADAGSGGREIGCQQGQAPMTAGSCLGPHGRPFGPNPFHSKALLDLPGSVHHQPRPFSPCCSLHQGSCRKTREATAMVNWCKFNIHSFESNTLASPVPQHAPTPAVRTTSLPVAMQMSDSIMHGQIFSQKTCQILLHCHFPEC